MRRIAVIAAVIVIVTVAAGIGSMAIMDADSAAHEIDAFASTISMIAMRDIEREARGAQSLDCLKRMAITLSDVHSKLIDLPSHHRLAWIFSNMQNDLDAVILQDMRVWKTINYKSESSVFDADDAKAIEDSVVVHRSN